MVALAVTVTVTDAGGHQATAVANATIASGLPTLAEVGHDPAMITSVRTTNITYSTPGQVVTGVHFDGCRVSVTAPDVSFLHCLVTGDNSTAALFTCTNGNAKRVKIKRTTFRPKVPNPSTNGITGHDFELDECLIEKVTDGCSIQNTTAFGAIGPGWATGVKITRTIIRRLARWTAATTGVVHTTDSITHNDGIQQFGGVGTIIDRSIIDCKTPALQYGHLVLQSAAGHIYTEAEAYALPDNAQLISVPMQSLANGGPYAFPGDANHPPRPLPWEDNGTGLISRGALAKPDLSCLMVNNTQGYSAAFDIKDSMFLGGEFAINGGGNPYPGSNISFGSIARCKFDHSQGDQGSGGNTTHTITLWGNWTGHCTIPTTGPDASTYDDGATLTVRL